MTQRSIVIVGAGGHGQVLADALRAEGRTVLGFADEAITGTVVDLPVLGTEASLNPQGGYDLVNGVGWTGLASGRGVRRALQERLEQRGLRFTGVRHPSAIVSPHAILARDTQLLARSIVQTGAVLGRGVIVNTGVIIEHGVSVGDFTHCATGAVLCGDVSIRSDSHIGAGAIVRQGVSLETGVVVGAGAAVIGPGEGAGVLVGVPARRRGTI